MFEIADLNKGKRTHEEELWLAVLMQAFKDSMSISNPKISKHARNWWTHTRYENDIKALCDLANIDAQYLIDGVRKKIKEKFGKKKEDKVKIKETKKNKNQVKEVKKVANNHHFEQSEVSSGELSKERYPLTSNDVRIGLMRKVANKPLFGAEGVLSYNVALMLRNMTLEGAPLVWFHVPNEAGKSGVRYGASLNSMGRIAGAPDYIVTTPKGTVFVELKAKNGKMSQKQKEFKEWCGIVGTRYIEARSVDEVRKAVNEYI